MVSFLWRNLTRPRKQWPTKFLQSRERFNATYDTLTTHFDQYMQAEEPNIQAGKAAPTATYDYFAAQRALMAQAKANLD